MPGTAECVGERANGVHTATFKALRRVGTVIPPRPFRDWRGKAERRR